MKNKIKDKVNSLQPQIISSIVDCVKIPSVIDNATENCPFGENIDKALRHTLALFASLLDLKQYIKMDIMDMQKLVKEKK